MKNKSSVDKPKPTRLERYEAGEPCANNEYFGAIFEHYSWEREEKLKEAEHV